MKNDPNAVATVAIYMHDLTGGGVERQVLKLAKELQNTGFCVQLVLHSLEGDLQSSVADDLPIYNLGSKRTLGDIPRLAAYLRRNQPDILLANVDHNNVAALLARALSPAIATKVVICQHNALSPAFAAQGRWTYRFVPMAYRTLAPLVAGAVAVSTGIAEEVAKTIPRRKIRVIHNGVIGQDFEARAGAKVDHPWFGRAGKLFVTAGRLVAPKDHAMLLRAFAIHQRRYRDSRLLILGNGPLREPLEQQAYQLGLSAVVDFLGFKANPLPYFARADCFVLSSNSEGFGNVLVEALGCGTPVISTDCPHGPAEILDRGRYGVLTRPEAADQLAAAMDSVDHLRRRWPASALQARASEFSDSSSALKYGALFRAVMANQLREPAGIAVVS